MRPGVIILAFLGLFSTSLLALDGAKSGVSVLDQKLDSDKKWSGEWRFSLLGISTEEGKDEGTAAGLYTSANFNYRLNDFLKVRISPNLNLFSSRVQERYDDDTFQSRMYLYDAYISAEPSQYFEFRAGALNQRYHGASMLVSGLRSFPGIQEIAKINAGGVGAQLILQQAVPTSHSLNTEREREEKQPAFTTETVALNGKHFGWLGWDIRGGHFRWSNIPAKVVYESRRIGNVGYGDTVPNNGFLYGHEGFYGATEFCYCSNSSLDLVVEYQRVINTDAPSNAADAQLWGIGPKIRFSGLELDLRYRRYFIESDATVAYYNKSRFGNTNRIGHNIEASLHFEKDRFSIVTEAYMADPINRDPNQRELNIFLIGVETDYASF